MQKCVVFDFDNTLARATDGYDGLFQVFMQDGLSREYLAALYEKVKEASTFSIINFCDALEKEGKVFDRSLREQEAEVWLKNSLAVYEDAHTVLLFARKKGLHIVIVTAGDPHYQKKKIAYTKIPHEEVHVTEIGAKLPVVEMLSKKYTPPLIYIDDRPMELDRIRDKLPESRVLTVWLRRPGAKYAGDRANHTHIIIESLTELIPFLEK